MPEYSDYLDILEEMLDTVRSDVDKSEGSLIWESLAAVANELEIVLQVFEKYINNATILTADREHLLKHAEPYGLYPYPPSYAVVEAEFICDEGVSIEIGSRFTYNNIFYFVTEKVSDTKYHLQCEQAGTIGNRNFGQLLPVFSLQGFRSANITALLIPGEDEESTEAFRMRVQQAIAGEAFGGNHLDYLQKLNSIAGIGDCKIIRCPRGEGSVDVIIVDANYSPASEELIELAQETLRPLDIESEPRIHNCGTGVVPIGHDTIVRSAKSVDLKVNFQLIYDEGYNYDSVKETVEASIKDYLLTLTKDWGDFNHYNEAIQKEYHERFITIQVNKIGSLLFDIDGVHDYVQGSITLNGSTQDIELNFDEIPVFGGASDGQ